MSASLTHRASGLINLAIGSMAMIPALTFNELRTTGDLVLPVVWLPSRFHLADPMGTVPAALLATVVGVSVFVLSLLVVLHPMRHAPAVTKAVASLGISLVLQGVALERFGARLRGTPHVFPDNNLSLFGGLVSADRLLFAAGAIALTAACASYLRWTRAGLVLRAANDNETGVLLLGYSPLRTSLVAWVIAGTVTSFAGVLLASFAGVAPPQFTLYAVPALGAALAGRFRNLSVVCAVGLGIGAMQSWAVHLGASETLPRWLQHGVDDALPLIAIVVALVITGDSLPHRGTMLERSHPRAGTAPHPALWVVVSAVALTATWMGSSGLRLALVQTLITAVLALSLVVSAGYIGQVSLAQVTIAGLSAYVLAGLTTGLGVPFPLAPMLAIACSAAIGFVVGIPALRIRGAQLMVVSLAFALAINRLVLENTSLAGFTTSVTIAPPRFLGLDLGVFGPGGFPAPRLVTFFIVVAVLSFVMVSNLRRGPVGRRWLAVRGNERAASASGVNLLRTKLTASAVSVGLAGAAGVLIAYNSETVSYRLFDPEIALALVALVYLAGVASIPGALVAGVLAAGGLLEFVFDIGAGKGGHSIWYGVALIVVAVKLPAGLAGAFGDTWRRIVPRGRNHPAEAR